MTRLAALPSSALLVALGMLLSAAACTPQQQDDAFGVACVGVATADAGFQVYAATSKVSTSVLRDETLAVAAAQAICSGPRPADVASSLSALRRALSAIAAATTRARAQAI